MSQGIVPRLDSEPHLPLVIGSSDRQQHGYGKEIRVKRDI
jgi:hypothetical protein